jgi:N-acetylmuramoyl-L-alanine amidase
VDVIYTKRDVLLIWLKELILQIELMLIFVSIQTLIEYCPDCTETYVMGMNKIASNLEAAKKRTQLLLRERL